MASFFSQSSAPRPRPSIFDSLSRRSFSQGMFYPRPTPGVMPVVWTIIGLNTAVFGAWQYAQANKNRRLERQLFENATLSEGNLQSGRTWILITSAFSHRDLNHFMFNMIACYTFGEILSFIPGVGPVKVMALAFGSAAAGSFAWLYHIRTKTQPQPRKDSGFWSRMSNTPIVRTINVALGASGMVMGMSAAATCLVPTRPMSLPLIPLRFPLWVMTALYFAVDAYYLDSSTSQIGHSAHLGGAVFGAAFYAAVLSRLGGISAILRRGLRR